MQDAPHGSPDEIVSRILDYLKEDEGIDLVYLNSELIMLSECVSRMGIKELDMNEIGTLLQGIRIIEAQLKNLGLVSHLLKTMRDSLYKDTI